jgi:plastocyanin
MRRRQTFLTVAFAASLAGGCLGSAPQTSDPQPSQSTPSTGNNGASNGSGSANNGGSSSSGGSTTPTPTPTPTPDPTPTPTPTPTGPPATQGSIAVALDKSTDTIRLNESKTYTVTLTPSGGFSGDVVLSLEGAPAGITATFTPAQLMVSGTTPATAQVAVKVASDMATPAASVPLSVKGTSGTISNSAALGMQVPAELLVQIPKGVSIGTAAAPNMTAFGAYGMPVLEVAAGTKVTWVNTDTINHEIHSDGSLGIAHEGGPLMANSANAYTQTFKTAGTFSYRCHIHPNMKGEIIVK